MSESDNYDTLEKIGHGSFGIIRKVRRKADGFVMCRKEISYLRMSQKEREQLHAEFQILSHLRHPNIVAYYHREHLKQSQDLHLYMEYCGNGDLGRVIKDLADRGVHAQESFVWSIFSQLVAALYRCHYGVDPPDVGTDVLGLSQGGVAHKAPAGAVTILHRDLKPENVFLGEDNSVKLGDFGLSKMIKSHDFASTYVGTPFYMSPEICNAEKYTLKSDIWSLGCIIYELCAREPPFNAKSHYQLVQKIKDGKVATLPDIYSPELNQVIRDCLRVNPDTRPDTASLLNLPVVRLMRKEKEVVDLNRGLRAREDAVARREKEVADKVASLESSRAAMRHEVDASLRREWEVKARLEIDRLVQSELEALKAQFETEVQARVDKLLGQQLVQQAQAKAAALAQAQQQHREQQQQQQQQQQQLQSRQSSRSSADFDSSKSSSCNTASSASASADDFQTAHGVVGDADIMVDNSLAPPSILGPPTPATSAASAPPTALASKRSSAMLSARTPYHRAQTMFVGTPMDVEMASPSPVAIQNLSLSPRRGGATKPPGSAGNIFTNRAGSARSSNDNDSAWASRDSDDDEAMMPSPSVVRNPRSIKNPFTSKSKPVLQSQQQQQQTSSSAPSSSNKGLSKLRAALSSASSKSAAAAAQAAAAAAAAAESSAAAHTSDRRSGATARHVSPDRPDRADRRLSKIPSVASLHNVHLHHGGGDSTPSLTVTTSIPRRGSMDRKPSSNDLAGRHAQDQHASYQQPASAIAPSSSSSGWTSKVVSSSKAKGIRGRTLIELQQARAYGRPLSAVVSGTSPSACLMGGSNGSSSASETPSPKRAAAAVGGLGGSGGNRENSGLSAPARPGHDRRASSGSTSTGCLTIDTSVVAVWDPELEDDMPSPFLKTRHVSMF